MTSYKLSIYIPTYNRAPRLLELLSTLGEIRRTQPQTLFEVVVADNASGDETYNAVKRLIDDSVVDLYLRRGTNLGADANILDCFRLTKGEFVWLLCDDDIPYTSSVSNILRVIESHGDSAALIYLNRSVELMNGEVTHPIVSKCPTGLETSLAKVLQCPGVDLLTGSTLVLKRREDHGIYVRHYGYGNLISPLTLALDALTRGNAYLFGEPQVRYREGDKSEWINDWPTVWKVTVPKVLRRFMEDNRIDSTTVDWSIFNRC